MHLHDAQSRSTPPPVRHSVYTLLTNLPFHHPGTDVAPWCCAASTRPHLHTRRSVPPVSGVVEEVSFLKVEKAGRLRVDRRGRRTVVGDDEDRRTTRSPDAGEKKPYLSTPNNITHVFYPSVYPKGMARGDTARTHPSAWLTTSSSPRWLVPHLRASELLAIFITVPSYTGYVERNVNRTDVVRV